MPVKFKVQWLLWLDDWVDVAFFGDLESAVASKDATQFAWPLHSFRVVREQAHGDQSDLGDLIQKAGCARYLPRQRSPPSDQISMSRRGRSRVLKKAATGVPDQGLNHRPPSE